jgi:hypothetical protein
MVRRFPVKSGGDKCQVELPISGIIEDNITAEEMWPLLIGQCFREIDRHMDALAESKYQSPI